MARRLLLLVFAVVGLAQQTCALAEASPQASRTGVLIVRVSGLPGGIRGHVEILGPKGAHRILVGQRGVFRLAAGSYRLLVRPVRLEHAIRGVPAGSEAFATRTALRVRVRANHRLVAVAAYGTVRSSKVVVFGAAPLSVVGDSRNPVAIVLPAGAARGMRVGSILARSPGGALPAGLFDRVTGVSRPSAGRVRLALQPASLTDAFPAFDIETSVPLLAASSVWTPFRRLAGGLSDVDLSFSNDLIEDQLSVECGAPATGWSFSPSGNISPSLVVDLHRGFLELPYGTMKLSINGQIGLDATLPSAVHCDLKVHGPTIESVIPVFGVPVPVEGSIDLVASIATTGTTKVHATIHFTANAGVEVHGSFGTPILNSQTSQQSGTISSSGASMSIGPETQVGIGASSVNGHIADALSISAIKSASKCELDFGGSAGLGADLGPFHGAWNPIDPQKPVWQCSGGGGDNLGPPVIATTGLPAGIVNTPYDETLQTVDGRNGTWAVAGGTPPEGLTLSAAGTMSGTPTRVGSFSLTVGFTDSSGQSVEKTISIAIVAAPTPERTVMVTSNASWTPADGNWSDPSWDATGTQVAFEADSTNLLAGVTGDQVYVKDVVTGAVALASSDSTGAPLSGGVFEPAFSPAGDEVSMETVGGDTPSTIMVKNLSTGALTHALHLALPFPYDEAALWNPDGARLAVHTLYGPDPTTDPTAPNDVLTSFDTATGISTTIASESTADELASGLGPFNPVAWSPDGRYFLYQHNCGCGPGDTPFQTLIWDSVSGSTTEVVEPGGDERVFGAVWSPDSQKVAFVSDDTSEAYEFDLATDSTRIVSADSSGVPFTDAYASELGLQFTPDGGSVIFEACPTSHSGTCHVWIKDMATGSIARVDVLSDGNDIPEVLEEADLLGVSADGQVIAFNAHVDDNHYRLYVRDIAHGVTRDLTSSPLPRAAFCGWSPTGHSLVSAASSAPTNIVPSATASPQLFIDRFTFLVATNTVTDGTALVNHVDGSSNPGMGDPSSCVRSNSNTLLEAPSPLAWTRDGLMLFESTGTDLTTPPSPGISELYAAAIGLPSA